VERDHLKRSISLGFWDVNESTIALQVPLPLSHRYLADTSEETPADECCMAFRGGQFCAGMVAGLR